MTYLPAAKFQMWKEAHSSGNLCFSHGARIRKIDTSGNITDFVGSAITTSSVNGTGSAASFTQIGKFAIDSSGNLHVQDNNKITRKVTPAGVLTTFATMSTNFYGITVDSSDTIYLGWGFSTTSFPNSILKKATALLIPLSLNIYL